MQALKEHTELDSPTQDNQNISDEERNQVIVQYLPLIRKIAGYVIRNHAHRMDYEDLVNVGVFGLIQALKSYDQSYDVHFAGYCKIRIRGAMLDELRRLDWVPRQARRQIKEIQEAKEEFHLRYKRTPDSCELAEELGLSVEKFNSREVVTSPQKMLSLNQMADNESTELDYSDFLADPNSQKSTQAEEVKDSFCEFTKGLTKTEQLVLDLYYQEGLNMRQAGLLLGISESRVCQVHSRAIQQLRVKYQHLDRPNKIA